MTRGNPTTYFVAPLGGLGTAVLMVSVNDPVQGSVISTPAGISCGDDCTEFYPVNSDVTITASAASGSTFTGWGGACSGTAPSCLVTLSRERFVSASFEENPPVELAVTVDAPTLGTVTSDVEGIDCGERCNEAYPIGKEVILTATAGVGSLFTGWSGACSGTSATCPITMNTAQAVNATFQETRPLTVNVNDAQLGTVVSDPVGVNCGADCDEGYVLATPVTLTATPAARSMFTGWSGACTGAGAVCVVTLDQARTVGAAFVATRNLTVTLHDSWLGRVASAPGGIDCSGDCTEAYPIGTTVALTATPSGGVRFVGWAGACTGIVQSCDVQLSADRSVAATFQVHEAPWATIYDAPAFAAPAARIIADGSWSLDPDGMVVDYLWDLSGPCSAIGVLTDASLALAMDGDASVAWPATPCQLSLRVTDNDGYIGETTFDVTPLPSAEEIAIQEAYIAYYGRPADPDGLRYWGARLYDANGDLHALIAAFGTSDEYTSRYSGLTDGELIDTLYQNLFGRDADPVGRQWYIDNRLSFYRQWWTAQQQGNAEGATEYALSRIALDILYGAQGEDDAIVAQKVVVSQYFTEQLVRWNLAYDESNISDVVSIMNQIDSGLSSVRTAQDALDAVLSGP